MKIRWIIAVCIVLGMSGLALAWSAPAQADPVGLTPIEQLGKDLFFDQKLSLNENQSCAACHAPEVGFVGPDSAVNAAGSVYEGSIHGAFGDRKPPTSAYGGESPVLYFDEEEGLWIGGMFWDGRATGWTLGDPLAEQAQGPFLNPMEQALPDAAAVCWKVAASDYAGLFASVWSGVPLDCANNVHAVYDAIGRSIAAYERSAEVDPFSSKFDMFYMNAQAKGLDVAAISMQNWSKYKKLGFDNNELKGLALFNTKAQCSACHTLEAGAAGFPLFTDFTYDNLGIPKNPLNPFTIANPGWADPGLGGFLMSLGLEDEAAENMGKFKVPTLRNVDKRPDGTIIKAYGHNGYFKSLEEIVHFYNTRDVKNWPPPEVAENVNTEELGNLRLNKNEEALLVTFMKTLSDGYIK